MKKENKLYETKRGDLTIPLIINGKKIRIRFIAHGKPIGYYFTDRPEIQSAIESHSAYGDLFRLSPTFICEEIRSEDAIEQVNIRHWQEGKELLSKPPYEIPAQRLETPDAIQSEGEKLGIQFIICENQQDEKLRQNL